MGVFNNLRSKNKDAYASELEIAEKMARVVSVGLKKENYDVMNQQLSAVTHQDTEREVYVFEHPEVVSRVYAVVLCIFLSVIFFYYLFIGVTTSYFSEFYFSIGMTYVGVSCIALFINITLISKMIESIRFKKRYEVYEEILRCKSIEFVEDISLYINKKEELVIKDLKQAVEKKLIPQGRLSRENNVFMITDAVYNRYIDKPAVYDRYFNKVLEERHRIIDRPNKISKILENGEQSIEKINAYSLLVKDKKLSKEISKIENLVYMIFHEIDVNHDKIESLGMFLNYYLPTTEKLLESYVSLNEKKIPAIKEDMAKKEIEKAINTIIVGFEGILEKLYEEYDANIESDIETMELSMKQEGLPV